MAALADAKEVPEKTTPEPDRLDDILPLSALREDGRVELLEILESLRGRKCLMVDVQLAGLISQIIPEGSKFLKDNGVQYFRELKGELQDFISESGRDVPENIVYLVRSTISLMKLVANQIRTATRMGKPGLCVSLVVHS
jgi:hypothetical protein